MGNSKKRQNPRGFGERSKLRKTPKPFVRQRGTHMESLLQAIATSKTSLAILAAMACAAATVTVSA